MKSIALGADHAGYSLKEAIKKLLAEMGFEIKDFGVFNDNPCDYPDKAYEVAVAVAEKKYDAGILFCGTGIGQDIVANKVPGIRAALCLNPFMAQMSRSHNDANILVLAGRILNVEEAKQIAGIWVKTPFSNEERHVRRLKKIGEIEKKILKERGAK